MIRRTSLLRSLALALAAAACSDHAAPTSPTSARPDAALAQGAPRGTARIDRARLAMQRIGSIADLRTDALVRRAIDPADYACAATSPLVQWIDGRIEESLAKEPELFLATVDLIAPLVPTFEAIVFQTTDTRQYFGATGEHTKAVVKTERELKRFWAIPSSDIQLIGMHGDVLLDTRRTSAIYREFGFTPQDANTLAAALRDAILRSKTMAGGNHPLFTFNAVAFSTLGGKIPPDKIIVGDGVLAGFDALGYRDVAPQAIVAHEFAHHVQFEKGYALAGTSPTDEPTAESTRFNELGADVMAAYYLTHKRGATMNRKRVEQFLAVFHQLGDCDFVDVGHHGTPNQRLAATRLGFELADRAQKQGHIMTPDQVQAAFLAAYPRIVAPDAR